MDSVTGNGPGNEPTGPTPPPVTVGPPTGRPPPTTATTFMVAVPRAPVSEGPARSPPAARVVSRSSSTWRGCANSATMAGVAALVAAFEAPNPRSAAVRVHAALLTSSGSRSVHAGGQLVPQPDAWDWAQARHEAVIVAALSGGAPDAVAAACDRVPDPALITLLTLLARPPAPTSEACDTTAAAVAALFQPGDGDGVDPITAGARRWSPLMGDDTNELRDARIAALFRPPSPVTLPATPAYPCPSAGDGGMDGHTQRDVPGAAWDPLGQVDDLEHAAPSVVRALFAASGDECEEAATLPAPHAPSVQDAHGAGSRVVGTPPLSHARAGTTVTADSVTNTEETTRPACAVEDATTVDWPMPVCVPLEERWDAGWCRAAATALLGGPSLPPMDVLAAPPSHAHV